jgi:hypothetical protein
VLVAIVVVVGGALVGAATAPSPPPPPPPWEGSPASFGTLPAPSDKPEKPPGFRRHAAVGMVVSVHTERQALAVRVRSQEELVLVTLNEGAQVKINRHPSSIGEIKPGDRVMVFGRPEADGKVIARALMVRRPASD